MAWSRPTHRFPGMLAAIFNLNGRAGFVHWHFIQLSWPNVIVLLLMLAVFVVALFAPFPGSSRRSGGRR